MLKPAGVTVTIMVYEKQKGSGALITCYGSGSVETPPMITGERVEIALLGDFDLDIESGDQSAVSQVEQLVEESFGKQNLKPTMWAINLNATELGFPLSHGSG